MIRVIDKIGTYIERIIIFMLTFFAIIISFIIAFFAAYIVYIPMQYNISANALYYMFDIIACLLLLLYKHKLLVKTLCKHKLSFSIDIIIILSMLSAYFLYKNITYQPSGFLSWNFIGGFFYLTFPTLILYTAAELIIWGIKKFNQNKEKNENERIDKKHER